MEKAATVAVAGTAERAEALVNAGVRGVTVSPAWSGLSSHLTAASEEMARSVGTMEEYVVTVLAHSSVELADELAQLSKRVAKQAKEKRKLEDTLEKIDAALRKSATAALANRQLVESGSEKEKKKATKKQAKLEASLATAEAAAEATRAHVMAFRYAFVVEGAEITNSFDKWNMKRKSLLLQLFRKLLTTLEMAAAALNKAPDLTRLAPQLIPPAALRDALAAGANPTTEIDRAIAILTAGVGESQALHYIGTKLASYFSDYSKKLRKAAAAADSSGFAATEEDSSHSRGWAELVAALAKVAEDYEAASVVLGQLASGPLSRHTGKATAVLKRISALVSSAQRDQVKWNDKVVKARAKSNITAAAEAEERVAALAAEVRSMYPAQIGAADKAEATRAASFGSDIVKVASQVYSTFHALRIYLAPAVSSMDDSFTSLRAATHSFARTAGFDASLATDYALSEDSKAFPKPFSLAAGTAIHSFSDSADPTAAAAAEAAHAQVEAARQASLAASKSKSKSKSQPKSASGTLSSGSSSSSSASVSGSGSGSSSSSSGSDSSSDSSSGSSSSSSSSSSTAKRRKSKATHKPSKTEVQPPPPIVNRTDNGMALNTGDASGTPSPPSSLGSLGPPPALSSLGPPPALGSDDELLKAAMITPSGSSGSSRIDRPTSFSADDPAAAAVVRPPRSQTLVGPPRPEARGPPLPGAVVAQALEETDALMASIARPPAAASHGPPPPRKTSGPPNPGLTTMAEADNMLASLHGAGPPKPKSSGPPNPGLTTMAEADNLMASLRGAGPPKPKSSGPPNPGLTTMAEADDLMASLRGAGPPKPTSAGPPTPGLTTMAEADDLMASLRGAGPPKPTSAGPPTPGLTTMAEADDLMASLRAAGPPKPTSAGPPTPGLTTMAEADDLMASLRAAGPPKPTSSGPPKPGLTTLAEADDMLADLSGPPRPSKSAPKSSGRSLAALTAAKPAVPRKISLTTRPMTPPRPSGPPRPGGPPPRPAAPLRPAPPRPSQGPPKPPADAAAMAEADDLLASLR
ncbi:uncharacterized protein AMSG_06575 [Thecamonas trahens ATCC 50062]|uniref:Uncharacterized protein n=1 Tax=Thecamonas trahens ATCC 50062 TaxID=461836 RepID=A0A0L0DFV2_THETB|nr:hypothetical protein AMSG_06575 [Thecamonas trahens ATCC 50062]KNC51217.1 hypothetical protein AMSG_06575 [Thecamonas trahens ATCC 50062]|eukprot:XP_013756414.1 hypothetical protein AMSG_06575 [Thecamonas trahens ATCC 50062]